VTGVVSDQQLEVLRILAPLVPRDAYLAGGVAIAVRLGHRRSRDLDWFARDTDPASLAERVAAAGARILSRAEGTLYLELGGVPARVIRYRYPLLEPTEVLPDLGMGVPVASLDDLASMKLSAIASRGKARDFWDLHEILSRRSQSLADALAAFRRKYTQEDMGHVVRSLVYFADADAEPLPEGLERERWVEIRRDFEQRVLAL
jgi:hypothetical protein